MEKQTADNKQPVLDGTRTPVGQPAVDPKTDTVERSDDRIAEDTSTVTLAEVAGYRAQIAKLENRQDTLSAEDRAKLVYCTLWERSTILRTFNGFKLPQTRQKA